jgi:DNA repair exonuclease SbcCD ATPase subunit
MNIEDIEKKLHEYRDYVVSIRTITDQKKKALTDNIAESVKLSKEYDILIQVRTLLEQCNIVSRDKLKIEFENLTTTALQTVFEDPTLKFTIEFITKRNQVEAEFYIGNSDNTITLNDIIESKGGGVVDVIAFSLRVILMELLKVQGPMMLDEPGKFISAEYIVNFGKFIENVSKAFGRQVIMITHNSALAEMADNTILVSQSAGVSRVTNGKDM